MHKRSYKKTTSYNMWTYSSLLPNYSLLCNCQRLRRLTDVLITSGKATHDDCTVICMVGFSKETKFVFMGLSKSSKTGILYSLRSWVNKLLEYRPSTYQTLPRPTMNCQNWRVNRSRTHLHTLQHAQPFNPRPFT